MADAQTEYYLTTNDVLDIFNESLIGQHIHISPPYVLSFIVIALILYVLRGHGNRPIKHFFSWLFPREMYMHPSHFIDIALFFIGRVFATANGVISIVVPTIIATAVAEFLSLNMGETHVITDPNVFHFIALILLLTMANDFCIYVVHRMHHDNKVLWPFHAVHHSAEILTPVTSYRKHPIFDFIAYCVAGVMRGLIQGVIIYCTFEKVEIAVLLGTNAAYILYNLTSANFRHSHIWISFGPVLEHIFISPAQHQIHHSRAPRHYDKNYGEIFALWDWMFGTLYIPTTEEKLEFGLTKEDGSLIQPHPSLYHALVTPFKESGQAFMKYIGTFKS